jgi:hypothetical protein
MSTTVIVVLAIAIVVFAIWRSMSPSLAGVIAAARETQDVAPVVGAVDALREAARPAAYNHAIRRLWDAYDRALAVDLVRELARKHPSALITQYWLDQVQKVEPELARAALDAEFLRLYYRPEVAARCGPVG